MSSPVNPDSNYLGNMRVFDPPIRQSTINACMSCRRYCLYRYKWGLSKRIPVRKPAANLGKIIHRFFELGPGCDDAVAAETALAKEDIIQLIRDGQDLTGELAQTVTDYDNQYNKARMICNLFWERYPSNPSLRTLCRELNITVEAPSPWGTPIRIACILDCVQEDVDSPGLYIRDTKTTTRSLDLLYAGYAWSTQLRHYRYVASIHFQRSPSAFILDMVSVPNIILCGLDRPYTQLEHIITRGERKGQVELRKEYYGDPSFDNYVQRCRQWYEEKNMIPFQSVFIPFTEPVLPDEYTEALYRTATCLSASASSLHYPRDVTAKACCSYDRPCDYLPLCKEEPIRWPAIIESAYDVVDPEAAASASTASSAPEETQTPAT